MIRIAAGATLYTGTGTPEGAQVGSVGDLFCRTDGGAGTTLYIKQSGSATNTGWVATATEDHLVKATAADTTPNYLNSKVTVGANLTKSVTSPGGDEKVDIALNDTVQLTSAGVVLLGVDNTTGTWKIVRSGNDLSFQRYESGAYVEKGAFTAA
jgi:hypothetical protein